jgi:predicted deacetylase
MTWLVVSVHDVSPATAAQTRSWCAALDAGGVPAALLVIPGPWRSPALGADPDFAGWLRERRERGDELVQHGWLHRPPATVHSGQWGRRAVAAVVARGAAEFAVLTEGQAAARLLAGRAQLAAAGIDAPGFTPPGWLASPGTTRALIRLGYRYTTSHTGVRDLRTGRWHPALALSHRPDGLGERTGAWLMGAAARRAVRRGADIRIALHPADLARPGLRDAALRAIDGCLRLGATPGTYLDLLAAPVGAP